MSKVFFLHAAEKGSPSYAFIAKLNLKSIEKLVDGEFRELFRCSAGFHDVEIALRANGNFGLNIEIYEGNPQGDGAARIERYDPLVKRARRSAAQATSHLRSRRRSRPR